MIRIIPSYIFASSITISKSFFVLIVAFKKRYLSPKSLTIAFAIDVLPIPGFPYNIIENNFLFFTRFVKIFPSPIKCFCPITSDRVDGANFKAKGLFMSSLLSFSALLLYLKFIINSIKNHSFLFYSCLVSSCIFLNFTLYYLLVIICIIK